MNIDKGDVYLIHGYELSRIQEVMHRLYDARMMTFDDRRDMAKILDSTMRDVIPGCKTGTMSLGTFIIADAAGNRFYANWKRDGNVDVLLKRKHFNDYIILGTFDGVDPITLEHFDVLKFVSDNYQLSTEEI